VLSANGGVGGVAGVGPSKLGGFGGAAAAVVSGRSGSALAAAGSGGTNAGAGVGGSGVMHAGAWKVMMLGDSITASTCYPQLVSKGLIAEGHTNFQFIGTQTNQQSCNATQILEEGHGGYGVTYLPENTTRTGCAKSACGTYAELKTWAAEKPEIVLMHYGTNDVWDGQSPADILSAYSAVIAEFRKQRPNVIFFVSKIIKLNPKGCTTCPANVAALAAALDDAWASNNSLPASPVSLIDNYDSAFDPNNTTDTSDGVHPTASGAQKAAAVTVKAVIAKNYF
jgi:hypothetical protein